MGILRAIAGFLGPILKAILPDLLAQWRAPRKARVIGENKARTEDIGDAISDQREV